MSSRTLESKIHWSLSPTEPDLTIQANKQGIEPDAIGDEQPSGSLTILIPGTKWENSGGWGRDNPLFGLGGDLVGQKRKNASTELLRWSGGNTNRSRLKAAHALRARIAAHHFSPEDKLNILAHSHGGNVALAASQLGVAHRIDNLITVNKPTLLGAVYQPGMDIGNFFNINARRDWTQWLGSNAKFSGKWWTDSAATNLQVDTSSSDLKPHGALIWDDQIREVWWRWVIEQIEARQG